MTIMYAADAAMYAMLLMLALWHLADCLVEKWIENLELIVYDAKQSSKKQG